MATLVIITWKAGDFNQSHDCYVVEGQPDLPAFKRHEGQVLDDVLKERGVSFEEYAKRFPNYVEKDKQTVRPPISEEDFRELARMVRLPIQTAFSYHRGDGPHPHISVSP